MIEDIECYVTVEHDGSDHNPPSNVMRNCLRMECEVMNTIDIIADLKEPASRALASWEFVFGILTDNSLNGLRVAIDRVWQVFEADYDMPEYLEDCFDGAAVIPVEDCDRIETEPVEQMLLEVARMPNRHVRKQFLKSIVACARREPSWEAWADSIAWFVRQAPGEVPLYGLDDPAKAETPAPVTAQTVDDRSRQSTVH